MRNKQKISKSYICCLFRVFFLISIVFLSQNAIANASESVRLTNDLFDQSISKPERLLVSNYLEYIVKISQAANELGVVSANIDNLIGENREWKDLKLSDEILRARLNEANKLVDHILKNILPTTKSVNEQFTGSKTLFDQQLANISQEKCIPNGFIENARKLEQLCWMKVDLWLVKKKLIVLMLTNLTSIFSDPNRLPKNLSEPTQGRIDTNIKVINGLMIVAGVKEGSMNGFKNSYRANEAKYNQEVIKSIEREKSQNDTLLKEIERQINVLQDQNSENANGHARLLSEIAIVIEKRKKSLQQKSASIRLTPYNDSNFLYLPSSQITKGKVKSLLDRYREVSAGLIKATETRCRYVWDLSKRVYTIKTNLIDTQVGVEALITKSVALNDEGKARIASSVDENINFLFDELTAIENKVAEITTLSGKIDFNHSDSVLSNYNQTLHLVQINLIMKDILDEHEIMRLHSSYLDLKLIDLLKPLVTGAKEEIKAIVALQNLSRIRADQMTQLEDVLIEVKQSYQRDADLTGDLEGLDSDSINLAVAVYTAILDDIEGRITNSQSVQGNYYVYLMGVKEQLKSELIALKQLAEIIVGQGNATPTPQSQSCADCTIMQSRWFRQSFISGIFPDILYGTARLPELLSYYTNEKLNSGGIFQDAINLFSLSRIIDTPPVLSLTQDSIDLFFRAGNRIVKITGVGNPEKLNLDPTNGQPSSRLINKSLSGLLSSNAKAIETVRSFARESIEKLSLFYIKHFSTSLIWLTMPFCIFDDTENAHAATEPVSDSDESGFLISANVKNNQKNEQKSGISSSIGFKPLKAYLGSEVKLKAGPVTIGTKVYFSAPDLISSLSSGYGKIKNESAGLYRGMVDQIKTFKKGVEHYGSKIIDGVVKTGLTIGAGIYYGYETGINNLNQAVKKVRDRSTKYYLNKVQEVANIAFQAWKCKFNLECTLPPLVLDWVFGAATAENLKSMCGLDKLENFRYGKWCGPSWSDGVVKNKQPCWSLRIESDGKRDLIDEACRRHDWIYQNTDNPTVIMISDMILINEVLQINESQLSEQGKKFRYCILAAFAGKIAVWDIPKTTNPVNQWSIFANNYSDLINQLPAECSEECSKNTTACRHETQDEQSKGKQISSPVIDKLPGTILAPIKKLPSVEPLPSVKPLPTIKPLPPVKPLPKPQKLPWF